MDRKIEKKKWPPKKIITIAAPTIFIILIMYYFLFGDHSSKLNVQVERITISTVEQAPFQEFIPITGTVIPIKTVYMDALESASIRQDILPFARFLVGLLEVPTLHDVAT